MKNFSHDSKPKAKRGGRDFNRDSGRKSFGGSGRSSFKKSSDSRSDSREMFSTICSECGKACGVPFKPTDNRPVLCKECFKKQQDDGSYNKRDDRGSFSKSSFSGSRHEMPQNSRQDSAQFEALNAKLDEVLDILRSLTFLVDDTEVEEIPEEELEEKPKTKTVKKAATKTKAASKKAKK
ncbi:MAG: hypothetical protein PHR00_03800 [Patescibacteria group bacterium]|nr:hypothetical protein [Patescibacteria group bacterium]